MATNLDPDIIPREPFRSPAPYLYEFRLFRLMTLWAVRPDICKAWNDHDVRPEVLRHGNIALGVRHKILSLDVNACCPSISDIPGDLARSMQERSTSTPGHPPAT